MTYELAKQLKDAGFPQRFKNGNYFAEQGLTFQEAQIAHQSFPKAFYEERKKGTPESELADNKCISIPDLSELIEACGKPFVLHSPGSYDVSEKYCCPSEDLWTAFSQIGNGERVEDNTPEEAVANLWLILNKKS